MDKRTLETILLEQKHELEVKARTRRCRRMEESLVNLDSNLAQVVMSILSFAAGQELKVRTYTITRSIRAPRKSILWCAGVTRFFGCIRSHIA